MDNREEKLKRAARLYAKKDGESLLEEAEKIRSQKVSLVTPRADKTVRDLIAKGRRQKRRKALVGVGAAAACIVLVLLVVGVGLPGGGGFPTPGGQAGSGSSDSPDSSDSSSGAGNPGGSDAATGTKILPPGEMLPISFTLPADYMVYDSELDNGMSVYRLESVDYGSVVLTMYYETDPTGGAKADAYEGFDEVIIDGTPVPAKVRDTYKLLAFDIDGMSYTLSSEDDLGSLAAFYRSIAESVQV
jgi:hypothetical protein